MDPTGGCSFSTSAQSASGYRSSLATARCCWPASRAKLPAVAKNTQADVRVQMAEARRHFDAPSTADRSFRRAIAITPATRRTADTQKILSDAYEMRARARFGLGDQNGAKDDSMALLKADPRTRCGQISPRRGDVRGRQSDGYHVEPDSRPAAGKQLDGLVVKPPACFGHRWQRTLTASGSAASQAAIFTAAGPESSDARARARVRGPSLVTSPPDVEVFIDGVSRVKPPQVLLRQITRRPQRCR